MSLYPPDYYADTLPCPICGEDVVYDTRQPRASQCQHCGFAGDDHEPDPPDPNDAWDEPCPWQP